MKTPTSTKSQSGSALMIALLTIGVLSLIMTGVLAMVSNKYSSAFQVASWQEALLAAESGADITMAELRAAAVDATHVWGTGWSPTTNGVFPKTYNGVLSAHAGEGNSVIRISVTVDAPASLKESNGRQWLRVRSTGSADIPGPGRVTSEKLDNLLRRLSLVWSYNKTTGVVTKVTTPRAERTIECIAKPATMFGQALMTTVQVKNDGAGLVIDSYNSQSGDYNPAQRQNNGDIASNAFPAKGDKTMQMNVKNDIIFGNIYNNSTQIKGISPTYFDGLDGHPATNTDPLIVTDGNADPTGDIGSAFWRDLPRVKDPNWATYDYSLGTVNNKDPDITVSNNPAAPTRVVADKVDLSKDTLIFKLPTGSTKGYVEMWVKGDINLKDGGIIQTEPGVQMVVYFDKNLKIEDSAKGAGFDVQSDKPGDLLLLGVEKADKTQKIDDSYNGTVYTPYKATGNISLKDGDLIGGIYAPDHNLVLDVNGAAKRTHTNQGNGRTRLQSGVDIYGAFVARTINAKGPANIHYDEAMSSVGWFNDYAYVSWTEDVNLDSR